MGFQAKFSRELVLGTARRTYFGSARGNEMVWFTVIAGPSLCQVEVTSKWAGGWVGAMVKLPCCFAKE